MHGDECFCGDCYPHTTGCVEWAKAHERRYGRENLDAVTLRILDEVKANGRGSCCKALDEPAFKAAREVG